MQNKSHIGNEDITNERFNHGFFPAYFRDLLSKEDSRVEEMRENSITKQWRAGVEEHGASYHCLTSPNSVMQYFRHVPSSPTGWAIRAFSPEAGLLGKPDKTGTQWEKIILDPFLIQLFLMKKGGKTFWKSSEKEPENIDKLVDDARNWLSTSTPVIRSGRMLAGTDGRILRFQETQQPVADHKGTINRAITYMHLSVYDAIASQGYASDKLAIDVESVESLSPKIAELVAASLHTGNIGTVQNRINEIVQGLVSEFDQDNTSILQRNFYLRKMLIRYLLKLDNKQYDTVRIYWAMHALQEGMRDRRGKEHGINTGLEFAKQAKDIELYHWLQCTFGANRNKKIDIISTLEGLGSQENFQDFCVQIAEYKKREQAPIFKPFFDFYAEWESFLGGKNLTPEQAQKIIARQYILILLSEIKIQYAYAEIPAEHMPSLKKRIANIHELRARFLPEKPDIFVDFSAKNTIIKDALKKGIASYT